MRNYPNASEGLKLMFYGEIVAIIGAFIPFVGVLLVVVGGIVSLVGLNKAGTDDEGYRTAFMLTIISIVVSVISGFLGQSVLGSLLNIVSSILSLAIIYFVCITTANLLCHAGATDLADRGRKVWNINLSCTVLGVVLTLLLFIPVLNILAIVGVIVVAIIELVGYIMYLMFLHGSYKAL